MIEHARRYRKMWGGGTRQAGILAAGALYAVRNHRARLAEDHANAKLFAQILATTKGAKVDLARVETNIVNVDLDDVAADLVVEHARALGLALNATGPRRMRAVVHLDVSRSDVERGARILGDAIRRAQDA
jgi:threonine aldolase